VGAGWCTTINVANLSSSGSTIVNFEILNSTTGAVAYSAPGVSIALNGVATFKSCNIGNLTPNNNFVGAARAEVVSGSGPLGMVVQQQILVGSFPNTDGFGYYNGVNGD
jgi:hypothetical protein